VLYFNQIVDASIYLNIQVKKMIELSIAQLQIAFFLTTIDLTRPLKVAVAIQDASEELFDADPLMLPIPPDAPADIPRIRLTSNDEHWAFQVTGERLDCFYKPPPDKRETTEKFEEVANKQLRICADIWGILQKQFSVSGKRIGVVSTFIASPENPVETLKSKFILTSNALEPYELHLHALHKISLDNIPINRWTRCMAANLPLEQKPRDALRLQIDINTLPEQKFELTQASIQTFVNGAKNLALETAKSLFEEGSSEQKVF
jgi:hypothetical protein